MARLIQIDIRPGPDRARGSISVKITLVQVNVKTISPRAIPSQRGIR
jgi:hypothetical protein